MKVGGMPMTLKQKFNFRNRKQGIRRLVSQSRMWKSLSLVVLTVIFDGEYIRTIIVYSKGNPETQIITKTYYFQRLRNDIRRKRPKKWVIGPLSRQCVLLHLPSHSRLFDRQKYSCRLSVHIRVTIRI